MRAASPRTVVPLLALVVALGGCQSAKRSTESLEDRNKALGPKVGMALLGTPGADSVSVDYALLSEKAGRGAVVFTKGQGATTAQTAAMLVAGEKALWLSAMDPLTRMEVTVTDPTGAAKDQVLSVDVAAQSAQLTTQFGPRPT